MLCRIGPPGPRIGAASRGSPAMISRPSIDATLRSSPMSVAGKASISRMARRAMYCAVHSPIPRIVPDAQPSPRYCRTDGTSSDQPAPLRRPLSTRPHARPACQPDGGGRCQPLRSRKHMRQIRVDQEGLRHSAAVESDELARSRRAATTLICCPRTARTAISKPSQPPGARSPGRCATKAASTGSPER